MQQTPQKSDVPLANNDHAASRPGIITFVMLGAVVLGIIALLYF